MEKFLETNRILKISLRPIKKNILHVASVKRQVTQRRIVCIVQNHNVTIVRNLDTWRRISAIKTSIKKISSKSMTMSNIFSMLPEIPVIRQVKTGTWIAVEAITWLMIEASSRKLTTLSKSKFDWEIAPW